jgi:hypothetical protein
MALICGPPPCLRRGHGVPADRVDAARPQEHHVLGEGAAALLVDHRVAAVLHHHHVAVELAQPRQRTGEDGDLARVAVGVVGAHHPAGADERPWRRLVDRDVGRGGVLGSAHVE